MTPDVMAILVIGIATAFVWVTLSVSIYAYIAGRYGKILTPIIISVTSSIGLVLYGYFLLSIITHVEKTLG